MPMIRLRLFGGVELSAHEDGRERRLSVAPKPLAMLAYLAVASAEAAPVRRDVLLALFWPELSTDRARAALRQLLFQVRRIVGEHAVRADAKASRSFRKRSPATWRSSSNVSHAETAPAPWRCIEGRSSMDFSSTACRLHSKHGSMPRRAG